MLWFQNPLVFIRQSVIEQVILFMSLLYAWCPINNRPPIVFAGWILVVVSFVFWWSIDSCWLQIIFLFVNSLFLHFLQFIVCVFTDVVVSATVFSFFEIIDMARDALEECWRTWCYLTLVFKSVFWVTCPSVLAMGWPKLVVHFRFYLLHVYSSLPTSLRRKYSLLAFRLIVFTFLIGDIELVSSSLTST